MLFSHSKIALNISFFLSNDEFWLYFRIDYLIVFELLLREVVITRVSQRFIESNQTIPVS